MFPFMPMLIGAGMGAMMNKDDPLKGAALGAAGGFVGGQFLGAGSGVLGGAEGAGAGVAGGASPMAGASAGGAAATPTNPMFNPFTTVNPGSNMAVQMGAMPDPTGINGLINSAQQNPLMTSPSGYPLSGTQINPIDAAIMPKDPAAAIGQMGNPMQSKVGMQIPGMNPPGMMDKVQNFGMNMRDSAMGLGKNLDRKKLMMGNMLMGDGRSRTAGGGAPSAPPLRAQGGDAARAGSLNQFRPRRARW